MNSHPLALSREMVERLGGKFTTPTASVETIYREIGKERARVHAHKERERYKAAGLTSDGKPYTNKIRPALHGITDRKEYMKAYHKLVARNRTKKGTK